MASEKTSVTALEKNTGRLFRYNPYTAQSAIPKVYTLCVIRDMPSVLFSRMIFTACGIQQSVVHVAARLPIPSNQTAMTSPDPKVFAAGVSVDLRLRRRAYIIS